ncbi:hypothetical protein FKP32DRAFT_1754977 [Trametes sanguinea]|nr:hypothetical protein FKP32DRAFT_1754977 [Trametes sanguinea]
MLTMASANTDSERISRSTDLHFLCAFLKEPGSPLVTETGQNNLRTVAQQLFDERRDLLLSTSWAELHADTHVFTEFPSRPSSAIGIMTPALRPVKALRVVPLPLGAPTPVASPMSAVVEYAPSRRNSRSKPAPSLSSIFETHEPAAVPSANPTASACSALASTTSVVSTETAKWSIAIPVSTLAVPHPPGNCFEEIAKAHWRVTRRPRPSTNRVSSLESIDENSVYPLPTPPPCMSFGHNMVRTQRRRPVSRGRSQQSGGRDLENMPALVCRRPAGAGDSAMKARTTRAASYYVPRDALTSLQASA